MREGKVTDNFIAVPSSDNTFVWYFIIFGLQDQPWEGGLYMGKITFPKNYPFKPPSVMLITENGAFIKNMSICLAISEHHPESWNPTYGVRNIILGLITFMLAGDRTHGSLEKELNLQQKADIALKSKKAVSTHKIFKELFTDFKDVLDLHNNDN